MSTTVAPPGPPTGPPASGRPPASGGPGSTGDRTSSRSPVRRRASALVPTEIALAALTLVTAASYARVFEGWAWLRPLAALALTSHLLALACRRAGWGLVSSTVGGLVGLAVAISLVFYRGASAWAGLPTRATWRLVGDDLSVAWDSFATAVPPIDPSRGYLVAAGAALWLAAWFADGFAFRARTGLEAIVPTAVLFVFASALARDRLRVVSAVVWIATALVFLALHRVLRQETSAGWLAARRDPSPTPTALRVAGGLVVAAMVAGAVLGPRLPGARQDALIDSHSEDDSRVTLSPLVDIRGRLATRSDVEAFTVQSAVGTYWRLTALTDFDGSTWTSRSQVDDARGRLRRGFDDTVTAQQVNQSFAITGLGGIWLPAAFSPLALEDSDGITFDPSTSSLVSEADDSAGLAYRVQSVLPLFDPQRLEAADAIPTGRDVERNLVLPADFPEILRADAERITSGADTRYGKALALQNYFRDNFTYDLGFRAGHSDDVIADFLRAKRGYCEQFAGTYAAFARAVGLPARVAVGFTQGTLEADGLYHVLGRHAHAWPEVYFEGVGWVPFEPTPGRGNPLATGYTGVGPAQADDQGGTETVGTTAASTPSPVNGADVPDIGGVAPELGTPTLPPTTIEGRRGAGRWGWVLAALAVVVGAAVVAAGWLAALAVVRRRRRERRRRQAKSAADRVLVAWTEANEALQRSGTGPRPSETPLEFAQRSRRRLGAPPEMDDQLAADTTCAAYAADGVPPDAVDRSVRTVATLERHVHETSTWRQRLRWAADPRGLFTVRRRNGNGS